jgi:flagellar hook-length control protein FliK
VPRGKTCLSALGTVCRSIAPGKSRTAKKSQASKHSLMAYRMARGLLTKPRDHLDEPMIAQPILTTGPTAKSQAQHQSQQQQQQNAAGFQSLLATTDSSLTNLAQNTGASVNAKTAPQPANANKPKSNDPNATTPYVAAPIQQQNPTAPILPSNGAALDTKSVPTNAVLPATDPSAAAATATTTAAGTATPDTAAAGTAKADQSGANGNNGNSTSFGADALNARIVAGAPIYASQPNASMATVPPHLLDAANAHPLPGEPVGKPGDDSNGRAPTGATATAAPSTANAATTPPLPTLPNHPAVTAPTNANNDSNGDNGGTPGQNADASTTAASNDPSTPGASLLTQPNQPQTAPIQVDAAAHTAAPYVPVGEQIALNLKQAIAADNNEIRIQLKPASLGTIDVKLNVGQDGRINAVISADRSDTLNMLKQDAGTLQQALKDAGLNADSSSLSFNLSSDAQSFAQNWSQGSGSGNSGGGIAYGGSASDALLGADAVTPAQRAHSGALDIEV